MLCCVGVGVGVVVVVFPVTESDVRLPHQVEARTPKAHFVSSFTVHLSAAYLVL